MMAWLFIVLGLSGSTGTSGAAAQTPQKLGQGVTVTPAEGWTSAQNVWNVGPNALSLRMSGVLVAFGADAYGGNTRQLLDEQLSSTKNQFGSFRSLPAASTTVGGGLAGLKILFYGTSDSSDLEGELVVAATDATGVVMMAVAPAGQLSRVQGDLDAMLASLSVPR